MKRLTCERLKRIQKVATLFKNLNIDNKTSERKIRKQLARITLYSTNADKCLLKE